jgi:hypothetical protein
MKSKLASTASAVRRFLASVGEPDISSIAPDWNRVHEAYLGYVSTSIQKWGMELTPMPSIALTVLFKHAVEQELAFEEKGRNFKDVIIFLSVVERMKLLLNETAALVTDDGIFAKREAELSGYASTLGVQLRFWTLDEVEPKLRNMLEETVKARFLRHQQLATAALMDALPEIQRQFNESVESSNKVLAKHLHFRDTFNDVQFDGVSDLDLTVLDREPEVGQEVRILARLDGSASYNKQNLRTGAVTGTIRKPIRVGIGIRGKFDGSIYNVIPGMNFSY